MLDGKIEKVPNNKHQITNKFQAQIQSAKRENDHHASLKFGTWDLII